MALHMDICLLVMLLPLCTLAEVAADQRHGRRRNLLQTFG